MEFINVRGCNGSGKTTLLRSLVKSITDAESYLTRVAVPDHPDIPFTILKTARVAILGDYTAASAKSTTAGCDRVKTQDATKRALEKCRGFYPVDLVIFEGVVVSTIYGPWKDWAHQNGGMAWAFLDTPLDVCLRRIQERNGGKPIQEDQVADKHRTIARVRGKAIADGLGVVDLDWERALSGLRNLIASMRS